MNNQQILTHGFAAANPSLSFDTSRVWSAAARTADSVKTVLHTARSWVEFWTTAL
jgi:hypothetical protein